MIREFPSSRWCSRTPFRMFFKNVILIHDLQLLYKHSLCLEFLADGSRSFLAALLGKKHSMDVWKHTAFRNGHTGQELAQFLVIAHSQLNVARDDACLLVITSSIASQFENFGSQVFQNGSQIDRGTSTDSLWRDKKKTQLERSTRTKKLEKQATNTSESNNIGTTAISNASSKSPRSKWPRCDLTTVAALGGTTAYISLQPYQHSVLFSGIGRYDQQGTAVLLLPTCSWLSCQRPCLFRDQTLW